MLDEDDLDEQDWPGFDETAAELAARRPDSFGWSDRGCPDPPLDW